MRRSDIVRKRVCNCILFEPADPGEYEVNQFEALLDAWRCGTPAFQPFFVTREGKIFPKSVQISEGCGLLQITADYSGGARDDFHIVPGEGELVCRRLFRCGIP